jgi:putative nucleotidyltransferase with HDIG domain
MKSKSELFSEMNDHLLQDDQPSVYFNGMYDHFFFMEYPFTMLKKLRETKQSPKYHPEGSVWNHTMLVVDEAAQIKAQSRDAKALLWASLLHDIGKPDTSKNRNGKITSYDHDKFGAELAVKFLTEFGCEDDFIKTVSALVRWHMQLLFVTHSLPFADVKTMKEQVDLHEVALLGFCDRMGRLGADRKAEEQNLLLFLQKCKDI